MQRIFTKIEDNASDIEFTTIDFATMNKKLDLKDTAEPVGDTMTVADVQEKASKKKRGSTAGIVTNKKSESDDLENEPFTKKYEETTGMLRGAIAQVDSTLAELQGDVRQIRASKTLKRKYDYLSMMQGTMGQFINTKVTALRELNNTITKCNEFEMKRAKELQAMKVSQANDDKAMMDLYNAFISMPTSSGMSPLGPSLQNISMSGAPGVNGIVTNNRGTDDGFGDYISRMSPSQKLMMYEDDPDVKQVVMYDESSGSKWFEIMNVRTGEVIEGVNKHDMMFMEDTQLDLDNNIARNINIGESYPIIRIGKSVMNNY